MSESRNSGGIGLAGVLTVVFVVLKLTEVGAAAAWSWLWVLSPVWITASIVATIWLTVLTSIGVSEYLRRRSAIKMEMMSE